MVWKGAWVVVVAGAAAVAALAWLPSQLDDRAQSVDGSIRHVFLIVLENKDYDRTFGPKPEAPYLGATLPREGRLLTEYYATGYRSLVNYIALVSGQHPNNETKENCRVYSEFATTTVVDGFAVGDGCVYPPGVHTVAEQLEEKGLSWRMYGEDMALREPSRCRHPPLGAPDPWYDAAPDDQYATRHIPFVYFHSIIDDRARCERNVVDLDELRADLADPDRTPAYAFITPDLCSDGHDWSCPDGRPGGYKSIDAFLQEWVPLIRASEAFQRAGLLIVTFDESDSRSTAPDPSKPWAAQNGFRGGRIGAVLLAPCLTAGTQDATPHNHYGLLRTVEDLFGLPYLGHAAEAQTVGLPGCEA